MNGIFTLSQAAKEERLRADVTALLAHHRANCLAYARILDALGDDGVYPTVADLPWLPVRLFKTRTLKSVPDGAVVRVLTSSGTTGEVSRIYLDRDAAAAQTRMLGQTLQTVLGPRRLPMLVVDSPSVVTDRRSYSARGAGALGMLTFGREHVWLLDEHDQLAVNALTRFLAAHAHAPFLVFGFTFMAWQHLYQVARAQALDLSQGILVHSGGWKKLVDQQVDNAEFRRRFAADTGLTKIYNFYGMVEQIGTIFLEGPEGGSLYCPDFADVIVRDPVTWAEAPVGTPGLIEVISTLPSSYPGNVLLTEDLGVVVGVDDGTWPGKRFTVLGRLPRAEARGCSDTYPAPAGKR